MTLNFVDGIVFAKMGKEQKNPVFSGIWRFFVGKQRSKTLCIAFSGSDAIDVSHQKAGQTWERV